MTSRVTALTALLALVAMVPVAISSAARSRDARPASAESRSTAGQAVDPALASAQVDADAAAAARDRRRARARAAAARARARAARFTFATARVTRPVALRTRPGGGVAAQVGARTQFGSPEVLSVARRRGRWLGVVSTALPNGQLGWVRRDERGLGTGRVRYSLHADISARSLVLRRAGKRIARLSVAVGRAGSSTPTGRFAVTDKLSGARFGAYYGCCILALSGKQPNLPAGWRGGNRLAIHGTNSPGSIGQASSAGCLRAADADLRVLMRRVPLGTPVFVRA